MKAYPGTRSFNGYKHVPSCKVCRAKDWQGNLLRSQLEWLEVNYRRKRNFKNRIRQQEFLADRGVFLSLKSLQRHHTRHAKYLKDGVIAKTVTIKGRRDFITHLDALPREVLQRIINYGHAAIENWWRSAHGEEVDGSQIPITGKLLMEALKEEGRRIPRTRIDIELDMMEKRAIEGGSS